MKPLADALERAEHERTRLVISVPPQHGKSTLVFHWLAKVLLGPPRPLMYITYNQEFALDQMRIARPIAVRAGVEFEPTSRAFCNWENTRHGKLFATGVGGGISGRPGGIIVVDDPIKGWAEAQSRAVRDAADSWLKSEVLTRAHPSTSVIVVHTRWHEDDLGGRLTDRGWDTVNLPAINDKGEALWPEERPIEYLEQQRSAAEVGPFIFEALYQGRPRPRGNAVFDGAHYTDTLPTAYQAAIGLDLSYSGKTHSNSSISLVLGKHLDLIYVLDVVQKHVRAPEFGLVLKSHASTYPGAPMRWYCSGTEQGTADFFGVAGVKIDAIPATRDKFVRAQPVAAAWNAGKILVPRNAPWAQRFVAAVLSFTGIDDPDDDDVDALAAAYDALGSGVTERVAETGGRRASASLRRGNFY